MVGVRGRPRLVNAISALAATCAVDYDTLDLPMLADARGTATTSSAAGVYADRRAADTAPPSQW